MKLFNIIHRFSQVRSVLSTHGIHYDCYDQLSPAKQAQFENHPNLQELNRSQITLILNMYGRLCENTIQFDQKLINLIQDQKIQSQSTLEFCLKNIRNQIQKTGEIDWQCIDAILNSNSNNFEQFIQAEINKNASKQDVLQKTRCKFPHINPKVIFDKVCSYFKEFNPKTKQNKCYDLNIIDKLNDLNGRHLLSQNNKKEIYKKHLETTNNQIFFRFPPEPNGFLHLGHLRSIRLNFEAAKQLNGQCYLRYDDTNPETESKIYIDTIKQNLDWLKCTPYKITHASDYFPQLYNYAIQLIKQGQAFVCSSSQEDIQLQRKNKISSPSRNRSIEENLKIFQEMKQGIYKEHEYCLRIKIDAQHVNPVMRDPVIYRIKHIAHPQTSNQWCIYPMYDFAHCICDSIENISFSLCTLEFEIRRDLYYWILDVLNLYKPLVWEFSRLNISNNVLSKRKLLKMVQENKVTGWDDPRLLTLQAMKRRGYPIEALFAFIDNINVTRSGNENIIRFSHLEHFVRKYLENQVKKIFVILDPVELQITNFNESITFDFPHINNQITINKNDKLYVEKSDILMDNIENFYGIAPSKIFCLKYLGIFKCLSIETNGNQVAKVKAEFITSDLSQRKQFKGHLHWITIAQSMKVIVRNFKPLFIDEEATNLNLESTIEYKQSLFPKAQLEHIKTEKRFQFERVGFYYFDETYSNLETQNLIFNQIVELKSDKDKIVKSKVKTN